MYQAIQTSDSSELEDLKTQHLQTLSAPLDAFWEEALIGFADHYEIRIANVRSGFYCINNDNQLVAFFLIPQHANLGGDVLRYIIDRHHVSGALVGTNDAYFLSLCLDLASAIKVHTMLFHDNEAFRAEIPISDHLSFNLATEDDFDQIFQHYCAASGSVDMESVETGFESLRGYVRSVMDDHQIFVLRDGRELLATSECRFSKSQRPYADVGMIVAENHRRKGIGSSILARTKSFCYENGALPICSCEADNIGSKKAITNAGFVSSHRIVLTRFSS